MDRFHAEVRCNTLRTASFYHGMMRSIARPHFRTPQRILCVVMVLTGCAASKPPSARPPTPLTTQPVESSPAAALSQAISMLIREGRQAKAQQKYPRQTADFAATYPGKPDPEALGAKLLR